MPGCATGTVKITGVDIGMFEHLLEAEPIMATLVNGTADTRMHFVLDANNDLPNKIAMITDMAKFWGVKVIYDNVEIA